MLRFVTISSKTLIKIKVYKKNADNNITKGKTDLEPGNKNRQGQENGYQCIDINGI